MDSDPNRIANCNRLVFVSVFNFLSPSALDFERNLLNFYSITTLNSVLLYLKYFTNYVLCTGTLSST